MTGVQTCALPICFPVTIDPVVKNNVIELYSDKISTEVSKDSRICLVYETGISINIPEGSLGIILPVEEARLYSLEFAGGLNVIMPGGTEEVTVAFKTNTDSIPAIHEPKQMFARVIIISTNEIALVSSEMEKEGETTANEVL